MYLYVCSNSFRCVQRHFKSVIGCLTSSRVEQWLCQRSSAAQKLLSFGAELSVKTVWKQSLFCSYLCSNFEITCCFFKFNCFNILVVVFSSTNCVTPLSSVLRNWIVSPERRSVSASAWARHCWPIEWQTARQACLTVPSAGPEILELSAQETHRTNENVGECNEKGLKETKQAVNAHCDCLFTYNQHIPFCYSASSFHKLACLQMF